MMLCIVMSNPYHVVVSYHIYSLTFVVRIVKSGDKLSQEKRYPLHAQKIYYKTKSHIISIIRR